ncbi:MAG TPA: hypothetical protein VE010_22060, partial [Thermoanaerobaculia bacterium]|nr:hypothetical protein [Thermoanaerobaculia bacterium]
GDTEFQRLFWQYLRVRNIAFRHLVEQPGTSGLDWFGRHYYRISPLRAGLESTLYRRAFEVQSRGLDLGAIEIRTSPSRRWSELLRMLRDIAAQAKRFGDAEARAGRRRPEVGLVLHFIKSLTRGSRGSTTLHADPRTTSYGCRYGEWFHDRWREVVSIERVLRFYPEMLVLMRGIDVANVELAVPTWTVRPLLRMVHAESSRAASRLATQRPEWQVEPMRTTVHAGEDYRTLLEGIRRIHELVEFGGITSGDRIGHAVALGEEPSGWQLRAGATITQPREERLDDLLWLLERFALRDIVGRKDFAIVLEREARAHAAAIYGGDVHLDVLLEARRYRHHVETLQSTGYPFMTARRVTPRRRTNAATLLERYLTDASVFVNGQQPVAVAVDDDYVALVGKAQQAVRRTLAKMQVTVESNPSSNLLIGELGDLNQHPAFRMQPLDSSGSDERLLLSINTDNPLTFATSLADEYAYIYYALLQHPQVTSTDALKWLDDRRSDGWLARFTLRASAAPDVLTQLARMPDRD